jgi:hypothetical protein
MSGLQKLQFLCPKPQTLSLQVRFQLISIFKRNRGLNSFLKLGGQVVMRRAAAARRRLLFCQNVLYTQCFLSTAPRCYKLKLGDKNVSIWVIRHNIQLWTVNDVLVDPYLFLFRSIHTILMEWKGYGSTETSLTVHTVYCHNKTVFVPVHLNSINVWHDTPCKSIV